VVIAPRPATVVVEEPAAAGPPPGLTVPTLPPGCKAFDVSGVHYYACGQTYYRPYFGNNGVYYQVVRNPL